MEVLKYWKRVDDDLFVITAEGLEDFRAVLGSKTSRAPDLNLRAELDAAGIEAFLKLNLSGYGHASIGEMSFPSVHHRGFGWIAAYLIEDDPLFIGQEVSSRAVDLETLPDGKQICYDAPGFLAEEHQKFMEIFSVLKSSNEETKGYKFDNIRWAIPGTIRTGVTTMMNARVALRHLERLESIPFMERAVKMYKRGIKVCSPYVYDALAKDKRPIYHRWREIKTVEVNSLELNLANSVKIEAPARFQEAELYKNYKKLEPRRVKDYLDPEFKSLGLFKFTVKGSVAALRDWHRHRPLTPWTLSLVVDHETELPFFANWYDLGEYKEVAKQALISGYKRATELLNGENKLQIFYSLPFGAVAELSAYATLPELLYMLELRAYAKGGNFEYSEQAKSGLNSLKNILGSGFLKYNSIE